MSTLDAVRAERDVYLDRIGKDANLLACIANALGSDISQREALVDLARKARRDQLTLAAVERELQDNHDIEWEGEPNEAMRLTTLIEDCREGRR